MPPRARKRRIVPSSEPEPSLPSQPAGLVDPETNKTEAFDLDNISGTSDDDDILVNDPDVPKLPGNIAKDIEFFFEKSSGNVVCRLCRYVCFLCDEQFGFSTNNIFVGRRKRTTRIGDPSSTSFPSTHQTLPSGLI
jgi:hypothetical protein